MMDAVNRRIAELQRSIMFAKRRCYQAVFDRQGPASIEVERLLADLRKFCFADRSGFDPDPHLAAFRAGKREVWLRIQYFLNLSDEEVRRLTEVESDYVDERG